MSNRCAMDKKRTVINIKSKMTYVEIVMSITFIMIIIITATMMLMLKIEITAVDNIRNRYYNTKNTKNIISYFG